MQINLNTYKDQSFTCPKCNWQGKGKELDIENISEEHWIIDFECPKCGEHIGSGQPDLFSSQNAIHQEKEKIKFASQIFKLAGEGGSITFYKEVGTKTASTWYYYEVSDMGFEEEDIPPSLRKSECSFTFWESLMRLKNEQPYFYNLYPLSLEGKFSHDIIALLRLFKSEDNAQINYESWAEALSISKFELINHVERKDKS